jgi:hypothetical protein
MRPDEKPPVSVSILQVEALYTPHTLYKALSTGFALVRGQKNVKKREKRAFFKKGQFDAKFARKTNFTGWAHDAAIPSKGSPCMAFCVSSGQNAIEPKVHRNP